MRKWLYAAAGTILVGAVFPFVVNLATEAAKSLGWVKTTEGVLSAFASVVAAPYYGYLLVGAVAFALGVFLDWATRRLDGSQRKKLRLLSAELAAIRSGLEKVSDRLNRYGELDTRSLTMISANFLAIKVTLYKMGVRTPHRNWVHPEDPKEYVMESLGWIAMVEPLLKRGHLSEVKLVGKKLLPVSFPPDDPSAKALSPV